MAVSFLFARIRTQKRRNSVLLNMSIEGNYVHCYLSNVTPKEYVILFMTSVDLCWVKFYIQINPTESSIKRGIVHISNWITRDNVAANGLFGCHSGTSLNRAGGKSLSEVICRFSTSSSQWILVGRLTLWLLLTKRSFRRGLYIFIDGGRSEKLLLLKCSYREE